MSLSSKARKALGIALGSGKQTSPVNIGKEVADAIDASGSGPAANVPVLTENGGAIGGSQDNNISNLSPSYVARTGSNSGTADGAMQAEGSLSTSDTYSDAAVNTILVKLENNIAELQAVIVQLAADNVAMRDGVREDASKINAIISALQGAGLML